MSKFLIYILVAIDVLLSIVLVTRGSNFAVLNPKGIIALKEFNLIVMAIILMLLVVIPMFIFTFFISWKYRASNTKAKYSPDWSGNNRWKLIWWAIPTVVIFILAVITWFGTHALDPNKPIEIATKPITIQVVALEWKWLFIYPEQNIATINYLQFPERTPVNFELTADAPMNSFWIPQLGGQMYAMAGMQTQLHLMADAPGEFEGSAVEINGQGFADMRFKVRASSKTDFDAWVQKIKQSTNLLDNTVYNNFAKPSENNPVIFFTPVEKDLYNKIMMKFMASPTKNQMQGMPAVMQGM